MKNKTKSEENLKPFCSKISPKNKEGLKTYAAKKDIKLYVALNEVIKKGLQN